MFLISKCCAGVNCRYNGKGSLRPWLPAKAKQEDFLAVCPEMLGGLPCPREGCDIKNGKAIGRRTGTDYTKQYMEGAKKTLALCRANKIKKAYLLAKSPSCGKGYGLTARLLEAAGIKVISI